MKRKGSKPEREYDSAQRRTEEWEEDPVGPAIECNSRNP